jgi:hypothetical protein
MATYCRWKFFVEAILRIPIGLLLLSVALVVTPLMVKDEVAKGHGSWSLLMMGIFPLLIEFLILSSGVRRLHAALLRNCWLKSGPEGISFRLPYKAQSKTFFLTNKIAERVIPWNDVLKTYPLQYKINGIPFGKALILETRQGRFNFGGYFKESPAIIISGFGKTGL